MDVVEEVATGAWVAGDPQVQASLGTPESIRRLVEEDFESEFAPESVTPNANVFLDVVDDPVDGGTRGIADDPVVETGGVGQEVADGHRPGVVAVSLEGLDEL